MVLQINSEKIEVIDIHVHPIDITLAEFIPPDEIVQAMDKAGVDKATLLAIDCDEEDFDKFISQEDLKVAVEEALTDYNPWFFRGYWLSMGLEDLRKLGKNILRIIKTPNKKVFEYTKRYPERFVGFGSVNPNKSEDYVKDKLREIKGYGFKGVKLLPTIQFFNPKDEKMTQIYEFAEKEKLIMLIHTGCDPGPWELVTLSKNANPVYLDYVCESYPNLKVIAAHMGSYSAQFPGIWFDEMVRIVKKHENLYVDIAATFSEKNLKKAVKEVGAEKILYGSDYPVIGGYCDRNTGMINCVNWLKQVDLPLEAKRKIFGGNAKSLLSLK
jgi:hypothetical protein